jgi:hypothetical protein
MTDVVYSEEFYIEAFTETDGMVSGIDANSILNGEDSVVIKWQPKLLGYFKALGVDGFGIDVTTDSVDVDLIGESLEGEVLYFSRLLGNYTNNGTAAISLGANFSHSEASLFYIFVQNTKFGNIKSWSPGYFVKDYLVIQHARELELSSVFKNRQPHAGTLSLMQANASRALTSCASLDSLSFQPLGSTQFLNAYVLGYNQAGSSSATTFNVVPKTGVCGLSETSRPTARPTVAPSVRATAIPTRAPTASPTVNPSAAPTVKPTLLPTAAPSKNPTAVPTAVPSSAPTDLTVSPSDAPTA